MNQAAYQLWQNLGGGVETRPEVGGFNPLAIRTLGTPLNIAVIQVYAPTAESTEEELEGRKPRGDGPSTAATTKTTKSWWMN